VNQRSVSWARAFTSTDRARNKFQNSACSQLPPPKVKLETKEHKRFVLERMIFHLTATNIDFWCSCSFCRLTYPWIFPLRKLEMLVWSLNSSLQSTTSKDFLHMICEMQLSNITLQTMHVQLYYPFFRQMQDLLFSRICNCFQTPRKYSEKNLKPVWGYICNIELFALDKVHLHKNNYSTIKSCLCTIILLVLFICFTINLEVTALHYTQLSQDCPQIKLIAWLRENW